MENPIEVSILAYPSRFGNLKNNNHLYAMANIDNEKKRTSLHNIKHFKIFEFNITVSLSTLIFFPDIPTRKSRLPTSWMKDKDIEDFYHYGFLKACKKVLPPNILQHVLQDIRAYLKSIGNKRSNVGKYTLPLFYINQIIEELRQIVDNDDYLVKFKKFFFLFESFNCKTTINGSDTIFNAMTSLSEFLVEPYDIYYDLAVEFMSEEKGQSVYWNKDTVEDLLCGAGIYPSYNHLIEYTFSTTIAGARAEGKGNLIFMQLYHTDKGWLFLTKKSSMIEPDYKSIFPGI